MSNTDATTTVVVQSAGTIWTTWKRVLITVMALVAAAGLALGVVNNITLNHKIAALHHTVAAQQTQLSAADQQINILQPLEPYATGNWYSVQGTDTFGNPTGQTFYMPATTAQP